MLDFDEAVDLLKRYGYSSTTSHPYLYQNDDATGICFVYNDEDYGTLERVRIFKDLESFEEFLKELEWLKENANARHVRMILDNYEAMAPKIMYLRNEKLMVEGEMYDIDQFDLRDSQRNNMDDASKVLYEAGDLLLVYDEIKNRQLQYLTNIIKLKNSLRRKYFDLQKEVDEYNRNKVERELNLLPEVAESGINETLEIALKDKYNLYLAERPPYEEVCDFIKEVWDLCKQLELNLKYYDAQRDENDVHNELKIVNQKLELINKLNDDGRTLFGEDLVESFRKINQVCMSESTSISQDWINAQVSNIERKYAVFYDLDIVNASDYLREAIQNSNYADLAIKYRKGANKEDFYRVKTPLNEVAASLSMQYANTFTPQEQSLLVLYNNVHYRKLFDAVSKIENFAQIPVKNIINIISKTKEFSRNKSIVYDAVKKRLEDPINNNIQLSLFSQFDFKNYESFMTSVVNFLVQLQSIKMKMCIIGDINMYLVVDQLDEVKNRLFISVTNALNNLLNITKGTNAMIGIALMKAGTPVLYSPYYLDIGDVYTKNASMQMTIKELEDFELIVSNSDIIINVDPKQTNVARYYSTPKTVGDISVVSDIKLNYKTTFCKYSFVSKYITNVSHSPIDNVVQNVPVANSIESADIVPITSNAAILDAGENKVQINDAETVIATANSDVTDKELEKKPMIKDEVTSEVNVPVNDESNESIKNDNVTIEHALKEDKDVSVSIKLEENNKETIETGKEKNNLSVNDKEADVNKGAVDGVKSTGEIKTDISQKPVVNSQTPKIIKPVQGTKEVKKTLVEMQSVKPVMKDGKIVNPVKPGITNKAGVTSVVSKLNGEKKVNGEIKKPVAGEPIMKDGKPVAGVKPSPIVKPVIQEDKKDEIKVMPIIKNDEVRKEPDKEVKPVAGVKPSPIIKPVIQEDKKDEIKVMPIIKNDEVRKEPDKEVKPVAGIKPSPIVKPVIPEDKKDEIKVMPSIKNDEVRKEPDKEEKPVVGIKQDTNLDVSKSVDRDKEES